MHAELPATGEVVWIRQRRWHVRRASRHRGVVRLDVSSRHEQLTFLTPFDRLSSASRQERRRHVRRQHALARLSDLVARSHGVRTLLSAVSADVALLPHQLEPALAMVTGGAARVLIADEVGLGKTIQAGLVIAEIARRLTSPRVLVVVPATLVDQWRDELSRRFRITAETVARNPLEQLVRRGARGDHPLARAGIWIASLDYLKQAYVLEALPLSPWDLAVFDEAHGAAGESDRHTAASAIARRARRVLLLTATPHDGDESRFGRLLSLGDLGEHLTVFRRTRADIASTGRRTIRWHSLEPSTAEQHVLDTLALFERAVIGAAGSSRRDAAVLLLSVLRKRALSTMSALAISLERRQTWIERAHNGLQPDWSQPSLLFDGDVVNDDIGAEESSALTADVGLDRRRERVWLKRLRALAEDARRRERKVRHLTSLLRRTTEPAVVFTEFRHSLDALKLSLEAIRSVAVLHGGQTPGERTRELGRFLDGSASVLLATDVASLGLNLQQRARWVIGVELPWNPARLEQRLGRVDRIGQTRSVHFTVLTSRHPAESTVVGRLARRALTAKNALGDDVLGAVVPPSADIRASVIVSAPLPETAPSGTRVAVCSRWQRPAQVAAQLLRRRRGFARRWQSSDRAQGRVAIAALSRSPSTCVFSVPIVDGSGATLEEHAIAVRVPATSDTHGLEPAVVDAARQAARRSLGTHLARVRRWQHRQHHAATSRERAIATALATELRLPELQPGLFDRRAIDAFESSRQAAEEVRADEHEWFDAHDETLKIEIGRPHLAVWLQKP